MAASSTAPAGSRAPHPARGRHDVDVAQNPTTSLENDVAVTRRLLDQHEREILVGHSFRGRRRVERRDQPAGVERPASW
jgi:hypothetical protein